MIEVDINLNPYGSGELVRTISRMFIANEGYAVTQGSTYCYSVICVQRDMKTQKVTVTGGYIPSHDRFQPVTSLLRKASEVCDQYELSDDLIRIPKFCRDFYNSLKQQGKLNLQ